MTVNVTGWTRLYLSVTEHYKTKCESSSREKNRTFLISTHTQTRRADLIHASHIDNHSFFVSRIKFSKVQRNEESCIGNKKNISLLPFACCSLFGWAQSCTPSTPFFLFSFFPLYDSHLPLVINLCCHFRVMIENISSFFDLHSEETLNLHLQYSQG